MNAPTSVVPSGPVRQAGATAGADGKPGRPLAAAVRRARLWRVYYLGALSVSRAVVFFAAVGLCWLLADWTWPLSETIRRALWSVSALAALAAAAAPWRPWRQIEARGLAADLGRGMLPSDALLNAWELSVSRREGLSDDLVRREMRRVEETLAGLRPREAVRPASWARWAMAGLATAGFAAALLASLPAAGRAALLRVYYPFGAAETIPGLAQVLPGNARFAAGEDVEVSVRLSGGSSSDRRFATPELWTRAGGLSWEKRSWEGPYPEFRHRLANLAEPLSYKVRFRGRWTPVFHLEPVAPLRFEAFRFDVRSPAYTGRAPETVRDSLVVRALRGSRLEFRGKLNAAASQATVRSADGRTWTASLKGREVSWTADVHETLDLRVEAVSPELPGSTQVALSWRVEAEDDSAPRVEILAPAQDLLIGPREKLPITYQVSDDYGVARVALNVRRNDGAFEKAPLKAFAAAERPRDGVFDHLWPLSLKPGDELRYFISAEDNNVVSGPGEGASAVFTLRVASYEEEHRELEAELEEFRKSLVEALAEETVIREDLKKTPPDWASLAARQRAAGKKVSAGRSRLEALSKRMQNDPLTDAVTAAEYDGIGRSLAELERDALARADSALAERQAAPAGRALDETAAELERLSLLAEDVLQAKRMRDLLLGQEEAAGAAESLRDSLASRAAGPLSAAEREKWQAALDEIAKLTADIARQIQQFPQELPEDFVNQPAVKTLRFDEVQSLMEQARRALEAGDAAGALAAAEKMLSRLKEMQKTLREAGENLPGGPAWFGGPLAEELQRRTSELEALIERQEKLKAVSDAAAKTALAGLMKVQSELLAREAEAQRAWREALARFDDKFSKTADMQAVLEGRYRLLRAQELARGIEEEFRRGDLVNAPRSLEEAGILLRDLEQPLADARARLAAAHDPASSTATLRASDLPEPARGVYAALQGLEEERAALRREIDERRSRLLAPAPESGHLPDADKDALRRAAPEQAKLQADTLSLRREVQLLARKTATIGAALARRLALAAEAMGSAAGELEKAAPRKASGHQETALRYLREGRDEMQSAAQGASAMGQGRNRPMAGSIQPMPGGGVSGARVAPVRLPRADEYKPPKEFREELLRSLREKYPKAYERAIKDYYEHFAE